MYDINDINIITKHLKNEKRTNFTELNISSCRLISQGLQEILSLSFQKLKKLDIRNNNLDTISGMNISKFLNSTAWNQLDVILLQNNFLGDDGICLLAEGLSTMDNMNIHNQDIRISDIRSNDKNNDNSNDIDGDKNNNKNNNHYYFNKNDDKTNDNNKIKIKNNYKFPMNPSTYISKLTLRKLDLSNNNISDIGIISLCLGLKKLILKSATFDSNIGLKILILDGNCVTDKGKYIYTYI